MRTDNLFELFPCKKVYIISPHPDDASFSMGGVMANSEKPSTVIVTVFSRSQAGPGDTPEAITRLRSAEDDEYANLVGATILRLGFPDTSLRNLGNPAFAINENELQTRISMEHQFTSIIADHKDTVIFIPMGIGDHPDHIHCHQALKEKFVETNILFFEDLPYGEFIGGPDSVKRFVNEKYPDLSDITVAISPIQMKAKMRGLDCYKSQLHPIWRKNIEHYGNSLAVHPDCFGERYWTSLPRP